MHDSFVLASHSGRFRGVARGAVSPLLAISETQKNAFIVNKTAKFLHLEPFLHFKNYNSLDPPMGYTYYTPYFKNALKIL